MRISHPDCFNIIWFIFLFQTALWLIVFVWLYSFIWSSPFSCFNCVFLIQITLIWFIFLFQTALWLIVFVWLYSFIWSSPPLIGWNRYTFEGFGTSCSFDYLTDTLKSRWVLRQWRNYNKRWRNYNKRWRDYYKRWRNNYKRLRNYNKRWHCIDKRLWHYDVKQLVVTLRYFKDYESRSVSMYNVTVTFFNTVIL